ncbi:hypothetical protein A3SI_11659 [Nitritalea halalkaliphila LW7]|uniref:PEGA domain-containing protein n=1 Tax=Nitritalea halalkaliphila LW7 TaxID=1189621 RepID=I5C2G3_9BACT|nr:SHOCT domain-containing protein [Nitritalea halalkaliphila]EIM76015.1 hypothetical protein A3SI_11659 [Nitritalea halalkaliphila LW7]
MRAYLAILLAALLLFTSCSSATLIQSTPGGAKLYLNDELVGTTPHKHRDTRIVGSVTDVRLELEGYAPFYSYFARDEEVDVGAIIGGIFFLVPFLWTMKYKPSRMYELTPLSELDPLEQHLQEGPKQVLKEAEAISNLEQRLRKLKALFDEGLITEAEYEMARKRALEEM